MLHDACCMGIYYDVPKIHFEMYKPVFDFKQLNNLLNLLKKKLYFIMSTCSLKPCDHLYSDTSNIELALEI